MSDVVFIPNANYVKEFESPSGMVAKYLLKRGEKVKFLARRQVGVTTGRLKRSIEVIVIRDAQGLNARIGSSLSYAYMHHEGTRPHEITPDRHTALRFSSRGRIVYARRVFHPGTRPNKYLSDNLRKGLHD